MEKHIKRLIAEQLDVNAEMEGYVKALEQKEKDLADKTRRKKMEIERLEAERDLLKAGGRHHRHSHSRHRSHSHNTDSELVYERLPTGELVLYEEQVEHIEEPRRGVRIEKDKKGRMSISVPKYR